MEAVAALLAHVHSTAFRPEPRVTPPIAQVRWTPQALSPHNLGRRAHGTRPEAASPGGAPWLGSRHAAKLLPALNGRPRALAAHRLDDEHGELDVGEEADGEVNSLAADEVAVGDGAVVGLRVAHVDDEVDHALREEVDAVGLELRVGLVEQPHLEAALGEEAVGAGRAPEGEAQAEKGLGRVEELELGVERADADVDVLLGDLEAGGEHGGEDGVVLVLAKGGDLARGGHLDSEHGVGAEEAREGEHGRLDADVLEVEQRDVGGRHLLAGHDARGELDEVDLERLGDKGEGARRAHVGLDHLDIVVLREQLQVEGARDRESLGDLARDALDAADRLNVELLSGQDERGVARVDARVLDVLGDGVVDDVALLGDGIDLDLLGALDELRDDDGVVGRDVTRHLEELDQVSVGEDHLHGGAREDIRGADKARVADAAAEGLGLVDGGELRPLGLVDADGVEDG
mmetsp:Transcript_52065/g.136855  ORF Transcript_52065/g.136855 Transcript_52065/m.136855 type:complete len:461 (-) Transcript_52065:504-1886(-)